MPLLTLLYCRKHPAGEVYVTGTFDDWGKTVKLDKKGDIHEKLVELPRVEDKIHYKVRRLCFNSLVPTKCLCLLIKVLVQSIHIRLPA